MRGQFRLLLVNADRETTRIFEEAARRIGAELTAHETVEHLNTAFPHWFAGNFRQYIGHEDTMPVDGHLVLSLVAPRPAYVASAELDGEGEARAGINAVAGIRTMFGSLGIWKLTRQ